MQNNCRRLWQKMEKLFLFGGRKSGSGVEFEEDDVAVVDGVVAALLPVLAGGLERKILL